MIKVEAVWKSLIFIIALSPGVPERLPQARWHQYLVVMRPALETPHLKEYEQEIWSNMMKWETYFDDNGKYPQLNFSLHYCAVCLFKWAASRWSLRGCWETSCPNSKTKNILKLTIIIFDHFCLRRNTAKISKSQLPTSNIVIPSFQNIYIYIYYIICICIVLYWKYYIQCIFVRSKCKRHMV